MTARSAEREQFLADIITGAIEGGTGYWAKVYRYKWVDLPPAEVNALIVTEEDCEASDEWIAAHPGSSNKDWLSEHGKLINCDLIARGIGRIVRREVGVNSTIRGYILYGNAENDAGEIDADAADVIVQAGLFGELVYG